MKNKVLNTAKFLEQILNQYRERITLVTSLGLEGTVVLDMISKIGQKTTEKYSVVILDTGRLHNETYQYISFIIDEYKENLDFKIFFPEAQNVEKYVNQYGINGFRESVENRKECCHIRKVEPLQRALKSCDAWITGLRNGQSDTRNNLKNIEDDFVNPGKKKINPLADWTEEEVWEYIKENKIEINPLFYEGYSSIGCACCSNKTCRWDHIRSGRWRWEAPSEQKECGLHGGCKK